MYTRRGRFVVWMTRFSQDHKVWTMNRSCLFCVLNCQIQHENHATNTPWQTHGSQKNQQEPTHFLPTQRKNTTFAKQRNKKNTTEKAENPQESRLKQISIFK